MPDFAPPSSPHDQPTVELTDLAAGGLPGGAPMLVPQTEVVLRHEGQELARATWPPGEYVIGRGAEANLRGDAAQLSGQHARLTINYDHCLLEDLGSSNGTHVAGQQISECVRLFPNQAIRLGDVQLEIRRQRIGSTSGVSLAPAQVAIQKLVPEELLAHKRYAIGQQVARGGMGAILDAQQAAMKRRVAMKVMLASHDAGDVARFVDEAQITGQLEHPNIVPVHELGVDENDQLFYTMKFVRGITLKKVLDLLAQGLDATVKKYPLPVLLTIFQKACDAMAFAHSKGVIHRDLKPENLMLGDFGEVLLMDWGLAKVVGVPTGGHRAVGASSGGIDGAMPSSPPRDFVASVRGSDPHFGNTMAGTILGTPAYMAPEQARGEVETMDQRADIYSLGAILFEILHLRPPLTGTDPWAIVDKAQRGEIEWTRPESALRIPHSELPPSLLAVDRKALALDPAQRYQYVADLQADIAAYQNGFATSAEKAGAWKQLTLLVKRNKAASIGISAVLLVGVTLGTKAIVEGRRAEREAVRANAALADLKKSAPSMLALAESEAVAQHFESALEKTDVALRLDPSLLAAYWRRTWGLVALGRFSDAVTALKVASERDPANAWQLGAVLAQIEKIAAIPDEAGRFAPDVIAPVFEFLNAHDARGEAGALIEHLRLTSGQRFTIAKDRIRAIVGSVSGLTLDPSSLIELNFAGAKLTSLEQVRGIPCDILSVKQSNIESLEPLRGLRLTKLTVDGNRVRDLAPLRGMALVELNLSGNPFSDLSPLAGMALRNLGLVGCLGVVDLSPLHGMPLEELNLDGSSVIDLGPLAGTPLRRLYASGSPDLHPLAGMPLEFLSFQGGSPAERDLSPLAGLPLKVLNTGNLKPKDLTPLLHIPTLERLAISAPPNLLAPLRQHPKLAFISYHKEGYRPVAEVWAELDAQKGAPAK